MLHQPLHTCNTAQYEDILRRLRDARRAARNSQPKRVTMREATAPLGERVKSTRITSEAK